MTEQPEDCPPSEILPGPAPISSTQEDRSAAAAPDPWRVPLPRVASMEQWLAGLAGRRKLAEAFNGPHGLRRKEGHPHKDAVLRRLYDGERGPRFATTAELEQISLRAMAALGLPLPPGRTAGDDAGGSSFVKHGVRTAW